MKTEEAMRKPLKTLVKTMAGDRNKEAYDWPQKGAGNANNHKPLSCVLRSFSVPHPIIFETERGGEKTKAVGNETG